MILFKLGGNFVEEVLMLTKRFVLATQKCFGFPLVGIPPFHLSENFDGPKRPKKLTIKIKISKEK